MSVLLQRLALERVIAEDRARSEHRAALGVAARARDVHYRSLSRDDLWSLVLQGDSKAECEYSRRFG
jgi:hypothetical protein